uniref:Uncharacterized protein n=1 Tax=Mesocestoides corti TaxID=53468 RepID=A0A5K3FRD9_MESCO
MRLPFVKPNLVNQNHSLRSTTMQRQELFPVLCTRHMTWHRLISASDLTAGSNNKQSPNLLAACSRKRILRVNCLLTEIKQNTLHQ